MVWLRDVAFPLTISDQHVCLCYFANSKRERCTPNPSFTATDIVMLLEERRYLVYKTKKKKKGREFSTLSYDVLVMPGKSRVVHVVYYSFHLQK
jgi:hypothetical protein